MSSATLQSAGLLVLRLVVGTTFPLHGLDKLGAAAVRVARRLSRGSRAAVVSAQGAPK